ncbi:MAG TPA: caspase family protein [Pyrinomonadaceae bacterium]|jgi:hypothetical protein
MIKFLFTIFTCLAIILSGSGISQAAVKPASLHGGGSYQKASTGRLNFSSSRTVEAERTKTPRKRALLIGISKYQRNNKPDEWTNLNTDLDLELLQKVLLEKFKFAPEDIVVLKNEKATKDGILSAWRDIAAQTGKGDVVFVHFSGHGDSIIDDNGDEIDGKDESLIPYDYVSKKDFSKNIRDDEIGKILDELKEKQPANVTVSIDSCYSGTATRGDYPARGGNNSGNDAGDGKPVDESPSGLEDKGASYPKEYVFLAAASPRQTAKETSYDDKRLMGVYTLALVKSLSEATPRTSYRDLFERVNNTVTTIRRDQNPQLEGSLDELVFDGTAVRQERFALVRPLAVGKKDDKAILQIGKLQGATIKSQYALFAAGTRDPKDKDAVKLAEGEIIELDATTSVIKLDRQLEAEKIQTARAFETVHNYEDSTLKVVLQNVDKVKGGDAVLKEFIKDNSRGNSSSSTASSFNLAEFSEAIITENLRGKAYDIKIYPAGEKEVKEKIVSNGFSGIVMERKDGSILGVIADSQNLSEQIKEGLERESRLRIIKSLKDTEDPRLKIELRVVPVQVELDSKGNYKPGTAKPKGDVPRNAGGQAELKIGDYIMLEVENKGELDAYVTILNLQANGKIAPGFPQIINGTVADNLIKRGSKVLIPEPYVFRITEPVGEESFRAIATVEQTDFSPLIDEDLIKRARSAGQRGEDPVAQLLKELERSAARGPADNAVKSPLGRILLAAHVGKRAGLAQSVPPSWATSSFTYLVKEK